MPENKITPEIKGLACIICDTEDGFGICHKQPDADNCGVMLVFARRVLAAGYRKIDPEVAELKAKIAGLEGRIQGYEGALKVIKQGDRQGEVKLFEFNGRYYAAYIVEA